MMVDGTARVVGALILSSLAVAAVITVMFGGFGFILPIALVPALLLAFIVALPAYLLLRRRWRLTLWAAMLAGFVLGVLATLVLSLPPIASGAIPLIVPNWFQNIIAASAYGMIGAIGGLVFVVTLRSGEAGTDAGDDFQPGTWRRIGLPVLWFIALLGLATGLMFLAFDLARDRSCHNPLRDGGTSIRSEIELRLQIEESEWSVLDRIVVEFAAEKDWSIRSDVRPTNGQFDWLQISICSESGTVFSMQNLPEYLSITVYQPQGGQGWQASFSELYRRLDDRWPDRISFSDGRGQENAAPGWLRAEQRMEPLDN